MILRVVGVRILFPGARPLAYSVLSFRGSDAFRDRSRRPSGGRPSSLRTEAERGRSPSEPKREGSPPLAGVNLHPFPPPPFPTGRKGEEGRATTPSTGGGSHSSLPSTGGYPQAAYRAFPYSPRVGGVCTARHHRHLLRRKAARTAVLIQPQGI